MTAIWLAADYHFPSTYSCRIPMSSMSSVPVMPTPGPATVRLALIRTGLEYLGHEIVREELFPGLCEVPIAIRPPEQIGISLHRLRAYKWEKSTARRGEGMREAVIVRERAHASGAMTIYLQVPVQQESWYTLLLRAIGYWGQTDSLTCCVEVRRRAPSQQECVQPLGFLGSDRVLHPYFSCVTSEFRDPHPSWEEVVTMNVTHRSGSPLRLDVYVWPLIVTRHSGEGKLLLYHAREQ